MCSNFQVIWCFGPKQGTSPMGFVQNEWCRGRVFLKKRGGCFKVFSRNKGFTKETGGFLDD